MKVRIDIREKGFSLSDIFEGATAEEIVSKVKARIARDLPFALRLAVGAMSPLAFAQEVVKRYNDARKATVPAPQSCQEFLQTAVSLGLATIEQA